MNCFSKLCTRKVLNLEWIFSAMNVFSTKTPVLHLGQSPDSSSVNPRTQVLPDLGLDLNINLFLKYTFFKDRKLGYPFHQEARYCLTLRYIFTFCFSCTKPSFLLHHRTLFHDVTQMYILKYLGLHCRHLQNYWC